jgi:hypothetical protein
MTTFADGVFQYGGVPTGGVFTGGKAWFVRPGTGSDGNSGKSPDRALATLAKALSKATANSGDVVYLIAESNTASATTDYQSTVLDWNKDGVHLVGVGAGPLMGQRSRISNLSTATAIVNGLVILSADNCLVQNIEIFHGQGGTNPTGASIALVVSGQRNNIVNCQISGVGHSELDDATSCSLTVTGHENTFRECYIGLDTTIRATATAEVRVTSAARTFFDKCVFSSYTSLSTFKSVIATSIDRFVTFRDCMFYTAQGITSSVAPTGAISNVTPNGQVYLLGGGVFGYADVTTADDTATLTLTYSGLAANVVDQGVAKATDVA